MTVPVTVLPDVPGDRVHSGYPKMLYRRGGDGSKIHGVEAETCVVGGPDEEQNARADGWGSYGEAITGEAAAPARAQADPAAVAARDADLVAAAELLAEVEADRDQLRGRVGELEQQVADLTGELTDAREQIAKFDGDKDGNVGGGRKRLSVKGEGNVGD